jgi:hypothetical protein
MKTIEVSLPNDMRERLKALAASYGLPLDTIASVIVQHAIKHLRPADQPEIDTHELQSELHLTANAGQLARPAARALPSVHRASG